MSGSAPTTNPARPSDSHNPRSSKRKRDDDENPNRRSPSLIKVGGMWVTKRRYQVHSILSWRINRSAHTVEFHVRFVNGSIEWVPFQALTDCVPSIVTFLRTLSHPPREWSTRYNDWVDPQTGRPVNGTSSP